MWLSNFKIQKSKQTTSHSPVTWMFWVTTLAHFLKTIVGTIEIFEHILYVISSIICWFVSSSSVLTGVSEGFQVSFFSFRSTLCGHKSLKFLMTFQWITIGGKGRLGTSTAFFYVKSSSGSVPFHSWEKIGLDKSHSSFQMWRHTRCTTQLDLY